MGGKVFVTAVTSLAVVIGIVYLATRGEGQGTSLAAYSAPAPSGSLGGVLFLESFDLRRHRTEPVQVTGLTGRDGTREIPVSFEQDGDDPALLHWEAGASLPETLVVKAVNRLGPLQAEVPVPIPGSAATRALDPRRAQGWPMQVDCGDREFVLLSDTGAPRVGREGTLLLLAGGEGLEQTGITLQSGKQVSTVPLEPWGGAFLPFKPRSLRVRARLSLNRVTQGGGTLCSAEFLVGAAARRAGILDSRTTRHGQGYRTVTRVRTPEKTERLFGLAFTWDGSGAGALVDGVSATVRDGVVEVGLDLPGPGLFLARYTSTPLSPEARGISHLVAAGDGFTGDELLGLLGIGPAPTSDAGVHAIPYALATLAESSPAWLNRMANTTDAVKAMARAGRSSRDAVLLGLLGTCLAALIAWMAVVTIRGHLRSRARLLEDGEDWSAEADRINPRRGLLTLALLIFILASAMAALLFVLQTM
ncbi:MAG: hypothetical protein ISR64_04505 [Deltaproteobacteria bacterium]|nr:hypothetical protein [Deltaproteobacteria bacterium]